MHSEMDGGSHTRDEEEEQKQEEEEEEKEVVNSTTNENEKGSSPTKRNMESSDEIDDLPNSATEACLSSYNIGATNELPPIQNNQLVAESPASEPNHLSSSGHAEQETFEGFTDTESLFIEYNQLLSKYYKLEDQMQKVLHQLHQTSYWNSQTCFGGSDASQVQLPTHHGWSVFQYPSIPACAMGGQCFNEDGTHAIATACKVDPVKSSSCADDSIVKAAKEAAEKAISSLKLNTSIKSNVCKEKETERQESSEIAAGGVSQNISSQTDLTDVLNSWFSAGFYTGKYLSNQSLPKSHQ